MRTIDTHILTDQLEERSLAISRQSNSNHNTNLNQQIENLSYSNTHTKDGTFSKGIRQQISQAKVFDSRKPPTTRRGSIEEAGLITVSGFAWDRSSYLNIQESPPQLQPNTQQQVPTSETFKPARDPYHEPRGPRSSVLEDQHKEQLRRHFLDVQRQETSQQRQAANDAEPAHDARTLQHQVSKLEDELSRLILSNKSCLNEKQLMEEELRQERAHFKEVIHGFQEQVRIKQEQLVESRKQIEALKHEFVEL